MEKSPYLVRDMGENYAILKKNFLWGNIRMQGVRTPFSETMNDLKWKKINEGITDLVGIDIMSVRITICLLIHSLSLKSSLITVPNMKN